MSNFFVRDYLSSNRKDSSTHIYGVVDSLRNALLFARDVSL